MVMVLKEKEMTPKVDFRRQPRVNCQIWNFHLSIWDQGNRTSIKHTLFYAQNHLSMLDNDFSLLTNKSGLVTFQALSDTYKLLCFCHVNDVSIKGRIF